MFGTRLTERLSLRVLGGALIGTAVLTTGTLTTAPAASAASTVGVRLTLDGETSWVQTPADTVRELLVARGVPFDATDVVTPARDAAITGGMSVSWTPAIRVVVQDGDVRTAHRVTATRAEAVATELALPTGVDEALTYSRMQDYSYRQAAIYSPNGKEYGADDPVAENSLAVIHQIRIAFPDARVRFAPRKVRDRSKLVAAGSHRVYRKGRDGVAKVVYRKRFVDGELVTKRVVTSRVVRDDKRRVVRVGTGPNWRGLAQCESGGNPNAYNPAGYYGLYQFSVSTWHAVGGRGLPTDYGYWEQTKRAWKLYRGSGSAPWPVCGRYL